MRDHSPSSCTNLSSMPSCMPSTSTPCTRNSSQLLARLASVASDRLRLLNFCQRSVTTQYCPSRCLQLRSNTSRCLPTSLTCKQQQQQGPVCGLSLAAAPDSRGDAPSQLCLWHVDGEGGVTHSLVVAAICNPTRQHRATAHNGGSTTARKGSDSSIVRCQYTCCVICARAQPAPIRAHQVSQPVLLQAPIPEHK
jgi:hypothetical protein